MVGIAELQLRGNCLLQRGAQLVQITLDVQYVNGAIPIVDATHLKRGQARLVEFPPGGQLAQRIVLQFG